MAVAGGLFAAATAGAANAATGTGTASVVIGELPLNVSESGSGLNFGSVTPSGGGDTVVVPASDANADQFTVTGQPYAVVTVTPPIAATLTGPSGTLNVGNFTLSNVNGTNSSALSSTGDLVFGVGGQLTIPAAQAFNPGTYSGTFDVSVDYQ
jgi:hypothetical protein